MALPRIKKDASKGSAAVTPGKWEDKQFTGQYPNLAAFLSQTTYEDNTTRQTGTMIIFIQDGQLKMCLSDRDNQRNAFITSPTLQLLFDVVELGLGDGNLDWRNMKR